MYSSHFVITYVGHTGLVLLRFYTARLWNFHMKLVFHDSIPHLELSIYYHFFFYFIKEQSLYI